MDKKHLQNKILETTYNREVWLDVLKEFFGVRKIHQHPHQILVDKTKAEYALELGSFATADGREVGIFEVKLLPQIWIERNRVGLRSLLRQVYKYDVDAALIVFVQADKWRFSYVSEIRTEEGKKETEPKRYTYLFGKGETCRTASVRFDKLKGKSIYLNDLFDAFSVDKLTRDFFKTYKEFYESFSQHLAADKSYCEIITGSSVELEKGWKDLQAKPIRDFVKKLLGRIVFLQFLQKKEWMGCPVLKTEKDNEEIWLDGKIKFLQELFNNSSDKAKFHSEDLRVLFFKTLNQKRRNNAFEILMTNAETGKQENVRVPYLNGGLFDKDISFENPIDFPAEYFKDLLEFFEQYNFTIDENDPYDNEVGIDPEMLGHIFENLLEENREKGAFYTPKEIVHYMCQESLIEYLHTQLPDYAKTDFELLVRNNQVAENFTHYKKADEINEKLKAVKICDPAIGSGAFPMGLLKELFECRRLLYGYLKNNEDFNQAEIKKEIIQQNIYGVDLENGAVEIARLRFWLALVVDEKIPQPLPNLDYKIMQGNSLLEQFEDIDLKFEKSQFKVKIQKQRNLFGEVNEPQISITEYLQDKQDRNEFDIIELEEKYFDSSSYEEKMLIRGKIEKFEKEFINDQLQIKLDELEMKLIQSKVSLIDIEKNFRNEGNGKPKGEQAKHENAISIIKRKRKDIENQEKEIERLVIRRKELLEVENNINKPYFLWRLYFMEVFSSGGFDIVIGNPPYINLQRNSNDIDNLEAADYQTFALTGDIYCLFYELGNNLLRPTGNLCYITSNKWMNAAYGKIFRRYLLKETNPILLIDFSKAVVFPAAVVFVNILQFKKEKNKNVLLGVRAQSDFQIGKTPLDEYVLQNSVMLSDLNEDNWTVAEKQDFEITKQIDEVGIPIKDWDLSFFRGVTTGLNDVFHITEVIKKELINEDKHSEELIHTLLRGKDIKRYKYEYQNVSIIFTKHGTDIENYPAIKKYLGQFKKELTPKKEINEEFGRKPGSYKWFEIQDNTAYYKEFEKEKIIWIEISDRANYCLDTEGHYLTNSAYFITGKNLKYLLAVLNSRVMDFYFYQKTAQIAGGRKRYTKQYVELLPIPQITDKILLQKFEIIIGYLIFLNDVRQPPVNPFTDNLSISPVFENVLNMMVYELFFEKEMMKEEIDVLQYIDVAKNFRDIDPLIEHPNEQAGLIGKVYKWLQEQENPIRNRIILSNIRSKNIIGRINSTTH